MYLWKHLFLKKKKIMKIKIKTNKQQVAVATSEQAAAKQQTGRQTSTTFKTC